MRNEHSMSKGVIFSAIPHCLNESVPQWLIIVRSESLHVHHHIVLLYSSNKVPFSKEDYKNAHAMDLHHKIYCLFGVFFAHTVDFGSSKRTQSYQFE